jgi:hypothetical protein
MNLIAPFIGMDQPWTEEKIAELDAALKPYETDPSFIEQCLQGDAFAENIDNFVDLWHQSEAGCGLTLRDYLGFTEVEYVRWMKDSAALIDILQERAQLA